MTVRADTTRTIPASPPAAKPDPAHRAALDQCKTHAEKIRYACEQLPDPVIGAVRDWLAVYGVNPALPYMSSVVSGWRQDHDLGPSTSDLPKLTPELLAEIDISTAADAQTAPPATPASVPSAPPVRTAVPGTSPVLGEQRDVEPLRAQDADAGQTQPVRPQGWLVAWLSFVVGGLVSVAANVAHTLYPTPAQLEAWTSAGHTAETWTPSPGAMAFAAFWPIALILSVEVLTRVTWRPGLLFGLARYGGTTLVAAVAAVMSYRHMAGLLAIWGEDTWGAHIGPLAVDGLMVVAAAALLSMSRPRNTGPITST